MEDQKDHMVEDAEKVALVTGGSRGIGAALNPSLPFGHLVVVGGPLHSVVEETRQAD